MVKKLKLKSNELLHRLNELVRNVEKNFESNDFDKIIAQANKVIEIDNESAFAYFFRGIAQWEKGDLKEGYRDIKKVLEKNENAKNKGEINDATFPASAIKQFIGDWQRAVVSVVKIYKAMVTEQK